MGQCTSHTLRGTGGTLHCCCSFQRGKRSCRYWTVDWRPPSTRFPWHIHRTYYLVHCTRHNRPQHNYHTRLEQCRCRRCPDTLRHPSYILRRLCRLCRPSMYKAASGRSRCRKHCTLGMSCPRLQCTRRQKTRYLSTADTGISSPHWNCSAERRLQRSRNSLAQSQRTS